MVLRNKHFAANAVVRQDGRLNERQIRDPNVNSAADVLNAHQTLAEAMNTNVPEHTVVRFATLVRTTNRKFGCTVDQ